MKNTILALLLLAGTSAFGADITAGTIFTPGQQNITHVTLNAIVGGATINTTFFTDKSSASPSAADVILYYSTGLAAYRKTTVQNFLLSNTALITSQSEDTSPSSSDFVLTYDVSAASFKKVALQNLPLGSTNAFSGFSNSTPTLADFVPISQSSTNAKSTVSNLLALFNYKTPYTNLTAHTAPTNADLLLIWDSLAGANKTISIPGLLVTNLPAATSAGSGASMTIVDSAAVAKQVKITNVFKSMLQTYILQGDFNPGAAATNAHGLTFNLGFPSIVTCTVQCNSPELGYAAGDNVDALAVQWDPSRTNVITWGFNSSNVFYRCPPAANANFPRVMFRNSNTLTNMITNNWQVIVKVISIPQ